MTKIDLNGKRLNLNLSFNHPDPHTGLIADRTLTTSQTGRKIRVVELSLQDPLGRKSWLGDGTVWHIQIAWRWKEGDRKRVGTVQGYPPTTDGPWKFQTLADRVILWGDGVELEGAETPAWREVIY